MPQNPSDRDCEWCGEEATQAVEIKRKVNKGIIGTGTYIYCCDLHSKLAEQVVAAKASK